MIDRRIVRYLIAAATVYGMAMTVGRGWVVGVLIFWTAASTAFLIIVISAAHQTRRG